MQTRSMVHGSNRIPYRINLRFSGLAGLDHNATISFGLPFEPEDSQYGKSWVLCPEISYDEYSDTLCVGHGEPTPVQSVFAVARG